MAKITISYMDYEGCQEATDFSKMCNGLNYIACVLCTLFSGAVILGVGSGVIDAVKTGKAFSSLQEMLLIFFICAGILIVDFVFYVLVPVLIELHCQTLAANSKKAGRSDQISISAERIRERRSRELISLKKSAVKFASWTFPLLLGVLCTLYFLFPYPKDRPMEGVFCLACILLSMFIFVRARILEQR